MRSRRLRRILAATLGTLLLAPIVLVFVVSLYLKSTQLEESPFVMILGIVGGGLLSVVECGVLGCEAELLEGMESQVFDATLLAGTPVALDVDEWGRVLVAETGRMNAGTEDNRQHAGWLEDDLASRRVEDRVAYYEKWMAAGEFEDPDHFTRASDRLIALVDEDGDGVAEIRQEIASWNGMASGLIAGVESREGEILVTSIPSVFRVLDRDRDGQPEALETLATGFGVKTSLIGHDLHGLAWGPDGKVYFTVGDRGYSVLTREGERLEPKLGPGRGAVFRMNADGSDLEVFATGVRNPQELAFDDDGNLFTGDNNGDGGDRARIVYLVEGGETGWAMPYQTLVGDYLRGPWVAERLWEKQHPTQPAWVLPPVDYVGNGPAGFVHYPGLGLPDRFANAFFLCDYGYMPGRSGIWSFHLEPEGAGMRMVGLEPFVWSVLATDVDFSWDGQLFATVFDQFGGGQEIVRWSHPASRREARIDELANLARMSTSSLSTERLVELLDFPDQRMRLRAQFALAERDARGSLLEVARDPLASRRARLHSIWGLGQLGADAVAPLASNLDWLRSAPEEAQAQLARVAGESQLVSFAPTLLRWLEADSLRVRFFAAQALGALGDSGAVDPLAEVLRENADRDVFLRHAAVWAWHRIGDLEAVYAWRTDPSRSVRLGVLLALRHAGDPRIAEFLADPDPALVVEAARAIYDGPIDPAMAALARLAPDLEPVSAGDTQVGGALHRRVIGANVRLRSEAGAGRLARYVLDDRQEASLRSFALEALGAYTKPPVRDLTMGFYRPLDAADPEILAGVLRTEGPALIDSDLGSRVIEITNEIKVIVASDQVLVELYSDPERRIEERVAALESLAERAGRDGLEVVSTPLIEAALESEAVALRIAGRDLLRASDPDRGLDVLVEGTRSAPSLIERQHAWRRLAESNEEQVASIVESALDAYESERLENGVALEVIEAARARGGDLARRAEGWLDGAASGRPLAKALSRSGGAREEAVAPWRWALAGGDPVAGRAVFEGQGDCLRCHGGGGHGAGVGPSLDGVARRGPAYVLESLVDPSAAFAPGFENERVRLADGRELSGRRIHESTEVFVLEVAGGESVEIPRAEISEELPGVSGMPPIGLGLEPDRLRDVVAYVMTFESAATDSRPLGD